MFTGIGLIAFICIFGAGMVGFALRGFLPEHHRTDATSKTVHNVMSVVALLAALVLGLLVASTKSSFDVRTQEVQQFSANLTLLDRELVHFGQDATKMRELLRGFTAHKIAQLWANRGTDKVNEAAESVRLLDEIEDGLRRFVPSNAAQIEGRRNALDITRDLKRTSRLLSVQQTNTTPRPFLIVGIFWLSVLFLWRGVFAPFNGTVIAAFFLGALSVSVAINLIFDMDRPFRGFIEVSPVPMQQALDWMKP
ncbi:MAG: hypothetical protein G4V63_15520 [Candidatus Afipia apatlaquensis]|uniref:DUF4239 domain-containing protein n=1 Tax=Candidatus Afipia apatlaquensis TaxID=2712852 RepID=A0A7C9VFL3_9BRAD|nr:hypothetical protein [Candidatus Afipia apatlaquensis]